MNKAPFHTSATRRSTGALASKVDHERQLRAESRAAHPERQRTTRPVAPSWEPAFAPRRTRARRSFRHVALAAARHYGPVVKREPGGLPGVTLAATRSLW